MSSAEGVGALTMGGFLAEVGARFAEREALVFDDPVSGGDTVRWTYADLLAQARRVAKALIAVGVSKGTRVAILMGNRPESVAAFFGAPMAGGIAVPLSTFSPRPELEYLLGNADVAVVCTQARLLGRSFVDDLLAVCPALGRGAPVGDGTLPFLRRVAVVGLDAGAVSDGAGAVETWESFLAAGESVSDEVLAARCAEASPSDLGLITYSSGTTDRPKGMLHNHRAPTLQFWLLARVFARRETTRLWTALPVFWTAGMNSAMGATLAAGGCWVMQETFEPGAALRLMARERVTEPYTLPHQTAALAEHPDWASTDLSSMTCVYGKSAFARHPRVNGDTGWLMPTGFGLSETCTFFAAHPSSSPRELLRNSLGRLLPGNELRVIDPHSGRALDANTDGELAVRGPTLMEHYVKRTRDECLDADGFFHTGDMGFFDDQGCLHWTGRSTEMIKTGGANVSPAEIEVQLRACQPVKLARVVGVPDPRLEQLVVLCVTLKDGAQATAEDITGFLRERVASYKVPKRVLFFADGEIPMTRSDTKVRDPELLALVKARLGTEPPPAVAPSNGA